MTGALYEKNAGILMAASVGWDRGVTTTCTARSAPKPDGRSKVSLCGLPGVCAATVAGTSHDGVLEDGVMKPGTRVPSASLPKMILTSANGSSSPKLSPVMVTLVGVAGLLNVGAVAGVTAVMVGSAYLH